MSCPLYRLGRFLEVYKAYGNRILRPWNHYFKSDLLFGYSKAVDSPWTRGIRWNFRKDSLVVGRVGAQELRFHVSFAVYDMRLPLVFYNKSRQFILLLLRWSHRLQASCYKLRCPQESADNRMKGGGEDGKRSSGWHRAWGWGCGPGRERWPPGRAAFWAEQTSLTSSWLLLCGKVGSVFWELLFLRSGKFDFPGKTSDFCMLAPTSIF